MTQNITIEEVLAAYRVILKQEMDERFVTREGSINLKLKNYLEQTEYFKALALKTRESIKVLELEISNIKDAISARDYKWIHIDKVVTEMKAQIKLIFLKLENQKPIIIDENILNLSVDCKELGLNTRTINCLFCEGIRTIKDLIQSKESDLRKIPNFGRKSIVHVKDSLALLGLKLIGV